MNRISSQPPLKQVVRVAGAAVGLSLLLPALKKIYQGVPIQEVRAFAHLKQHRAVLLQAAGGVSVLASAKFGLPFNIPHSLWYYKLDDKYVKQSPEASFAWYGKWAKQGNAEAMYRLAACYHQGVGVEVNKEKGFEWLKKCFECLEKAALNGSPEAVRSLMEAAEKGFPEALRILTDAAEEDRPEALDILMEAAKEGRPKALRILMKAGHPKALDILMEAAKEGRPEAVRILIEAAEKGYLKALRMLTEAVNSSPEALRMLTEAAEEGRPGAVRVLKAIEAAQDFYEHS